ncbi:MULTISPECIES: ImmA/IrrE family metallo-endopeptidase [Actinosynnema]|uniref:ImmA/IrrE family metallo-endopeptidase n=1 Tax=Actinosynnema TaxID=40566 RepID=UPI0020A32599|nr:ImmA/IrrE family metallo-endopeptidase [Actinosynnema pretiosum]MCP2092825.1 protein of unknown function (DUF955) [Actinosynnema pretiosum]
MSAENEGREAAERFRREHHLGVQPLGDLVALIEQTVKVDVAVLKAEPDEHGLMMRDPKHGSVFIGVASTENPMRQRSTLAHELGHVLFEDWESADAPVERQYAEDRAAAFARHLLVPLDGLVDFLGERRQVGLLTLSNVVQRFLVSPAIAAIALRQAGRIDEETEREWKEGVYTPQLATRFGWMDQYQALQGKSAGQRAPQRLLARAINGYLEGVLSAKAIATLRKVPVATVEADLREAGIVPADHVVEWADAADLPEVDVDLTELDEVLGKPEGEGEVGREHG